MASSVGASTFKGPDGAKEAEKFIAEAMKDWSSGKGKLATNDITLLMVSKLHVPGLIIENKSSFPLEYVNSGYSAGCPLEPVLNMFTEQSGRSVIPPNTTAALLWCLHKGGNFGKLMHWAWLKSGALGWESQIPVFSR